MNLQFVLFKTFERLYKLDFYIKNISPYSSADRMFHCGGKDRSANPREGIAIYNSQALKMKNCSCYHEKEKF
jgi:hypothetical protein